MGGGSVMSGGVGGAVDFAENEGGWVARILQDVETGDAGFAQAGRGVFESGGDEGVEVFGFDADVNVGDEHIKNLLIRRAKRLRLGEKKGDTAATCDP